MLVAEADSSPLEPGPGHSRWVRLCHWMIAASVLVLCASGLVILMAHPRLYWGVVGNDLTKAWLEVPLGRNYRHGGWGPPVQILTGHADVVSRVRTYDIFNRNSWARSLHFLAAWLFVGAWGAYGLIGLVTGHIRRSILPKLADLSPARLWADLRAHLVLPVAPAVGGPPYGVLQKLSYALVALAALPLMTLTGLTMSPTVSAAWPILPAMFGGSQSARSIHFLILCALLLFLAAHLVMVVLSGFGRQMRAMTWGR